MRDTLKMMTAATGNGHPFPTGEQNHLFFDYFASIVRNRVKFDFVSSHTSFDSWLLTPTRFVSFVRPPTLISWQDGVGVPTKKQKRLPSNKCAVLRRYCATTTQVIYIPVPQPVYISPFHQIHHQTRPAFVSPHGGSFRGFRGASHFGFAGSHHFAPMQYGEYGNGGYSLQVGTNESFNN